MSSGRGKPNPKMLGNKNAVGNSGGGNKPEIYEPKVADRCRKLALLGLTDLEIAGVVRVSEQCFHQWKAKHPELRQALDDGRDDADATVVDSLHQRAKGMTIRQTKVFVNPSTGAVDKVDYKVTLPPDVRAQEIWLRNRRRSRWGNRGDDAEPGTTINIIGGLPQDDGFGGSPLPTDDKKKD